LSNYILSPNDEQVDLPNMNSINNDKIYLMDEARTQSGFKVVQIFGGNKKTAKLGFAPTIQSDVFKVENLLDACPGYAFTIWLDYLNGSIVATAKFSSKKILAGTNLFSYELEIEEE